MNICVVAGSNRKNSQSSRIANVFRQLIDSNIVSTNVVDLSKKSIPLWEEDLSTERVPDYKNWKEVSRLFESAAGFVFVVPEWNGMVPPHVKNLFLMSKSEFAHKPALIASISSGQGGSYPVAELRASSYKNKRIVWVPDHIIIRGVKDYDADEQSPLNARIAYSCRMLLSYAEALKSVRAVADLQAFRNGM